MTYIAGWAFRTTDLPACAYLLDCRLLPLLLQCVQLNASKIDFSEGEGRRKET